MRSFKDSKIIESTNCCCKLNISKTTDILNENVVRCDDKKDYNFRFFDLEKLSFSFFTMKNDPNKMNLIKFASHRGLDSI